jgi:hypothetical protein
MDSNKISKLDKPFEIRPYSHAELSALYGISKYIFREWIKVISDKLGKRQGWYYSAQQVKMIITVYGIPGLSVNEKE